MRRGLSALLLVLGCRDGDVPAKPSAPETGAVAPVGEAKACPDHEAESVLERSREATITVASSQRAIEEFWQWWEHARTQLDATTDAGAPVLAELSTRIHAVHPDMQWEIGPGVAAKRMLVATGAGDPILRRVALRWHAAAPKPDAHWEFSAARQAIAPEALMDMSLRHSGKTLRTSDFRVTIATNEVRAVLDVEVWHPDLADVPRSEALEVLFIALDQALGEEAQEKWLGLIAPAAAPLGNDAVDLLGLRERVAALAKATVPGAYAAGATSDGASPFTVSTMPGVKLWDHPDHDVACEIEMPYDADASGLPNGADLEAVQSLETGLTEAIVGHGVFHGSSTGAGKRTAWLFLDSQHDGLGRVCKWAEGASRPVEIRVHYDPTWSSPPF